MAKKTKFAWDMVAVVIIALYFIGRFLVKCFFKS
jgi:hypothetical protein